ncbi:hypothetical protein J6590_080893 [Homalodisca vitripennis]|nr:hypothetical protein J6590_080893 [Homalodisca vitripennis]
MGIDFLALNTCRIRQSLYRLDLGLSRRVNTNYSNAGRIQRDNTTCRVEEAVEWLMLLLAGSTSTVNWWMANSLLSKHVNVVYHLIGSKRDAWNEIRPARPLVNLEPARDVLEAANSAVWEEIGRDSQKTCPPRQVRQILMETAQVPVAAAFMAQSSSLF